MDKKMHFNDSKKDNLKKKDPSSEKRYPYSAPTLLLLTQNELTIKGSSTCNYLENSAGCNGVFFFS